MRVPLRLGIWDKGAQIHKQCPGLTELGCLALALLEEASQSGKSQRWPWLRVSCKMPSFALQSATMPPTGQSICSFAQNWPPLQRQVDAPDGFSP